MKKTNIFHRVLAFCIAILFCFTFITVSAENADAVTNIYFGDVYGIRGREVSVPLMIRNNSGIASYRFRITYDASKVEFLSVDVGESFSVGTLVSTSDDNAQTVTFLWYSVTDVTVDGEMANLRFKVLDGAEGEIALDVTYRSEDILNQERKPIKHSLDQGKIIVTCVFSGKVTSGGKILNNAIVRVFKDGVEINSVVATYGEFEIRYLLPGKYVVEITAPYHCTKRFELDIDYTNISEDYDINVLGDVNADGNINNRDLGIMMQYINGWETKILLESADFNGDGKINNKDYARLMQYINGWDVELQ